MDIERIARLEAERERIDRAAMDECDKAKPDMQRLNALADALEDIDDQLEELRGTQD